MQPDPMVGRAVDHRKTDESDITHCGTLVWTHACACPRSPKSGEWFGPTKSRSLRRFESIITGTAGV